MIKCDKVTHGGFLEATNDTCKSPSVDNSNEDIGAQLETTTL